MTSKVALVISAFIHPAAVLGEMEEKKLRAHAPTLILRREASEKEKEAFGRYKMMQGSAVASRPHPPGPQARQVSSRRVQSVRYGRGRLNSSY
jgi:hypothetical protein